MKWHNTIAIGGIFLLAHGNAMADAEGGLCASFDPASGNLAVPCVAVGGNAYQANLAFTGGQPVTFALRDTAPSAYPAQPGQCAVFHAESGSLGLPCVRGGGSGGGSGSRFWARLQVTANGSLQLDGMGQVIPERCQRLADAPAGASIRIVATGAVVGTVASATVRNETQETQCYCLYPGDGLRNTDGGQQDLGIMQSAGFCLPPGEEKEFPIEGSCINAERDAPAPGQAMHLYRETRGDLIALLQAIEREGTGRERMNVNNFAVWALTDGNNPLPGTLATIRQLYQRAGLDPAQYPGLEREIQIPQIPTLPGGGVTPPPDGETDWMRLAAPVKRRR